MFVLSVFCKLLYIAGRANESNGKASFLGEEDRAIEAAQVGDIAAVKAFFNRGGEVELRDSRMGMVRSLDLFPSRLIFFTYIFCYFYYDYFPSSVRLQICHLRTCMYRIVFYQ